MIFIGHLIVAWIDGFCLTIHFNGNGYNLWSALCAVIFVILTLQCDDRFVGSFQQVDSLLEVNNDLIVVTLSVREGILCCLARVCCRVDSCYLHLAVIDFWSTCNSCISTLDNGDIVCRRIEDTDRSHCEYDGSVLLFGSHGTSILVFLTFLQKDDIRSSLADDEFTDTLNNFVACIEVTSVCWK